LKQALIDASNTDLQSGFYIKRGSVTFRTLHPQNAKVEDGYRPPNCLDGRVTVSVVQIDACPPLEE